MKSIIENIKPLSSDVLLQNFYNIYPEYEVYKFHKSKKDNRSRATLKNIKTNKYTVMPYPKLLVEVHLNRKLNTDETVDHKDNNVTNNDISNLMVRSTIAWDLTRTASKGKYTYVSIKDHPNATEKGYVLLHRAVMENYLNRLLRPHEIVHHKDHNKKNNDITNLRLTTLKKHVSHHMYLQNKWFVDLQCPICLLKFTKPKNTTHLTTKKKLNCTCCSLSCSGKLSAASQNFKITRNMQYNMDNNVIKVYQKQTNLQNGPNIFEYKPISYIKNIMSAI